MISSQQIKEEYDDILVQLADPEISFDWERLEELQKKKSWLEKIKEKLLALEKILRHIQENEAIISAGEDRDLDILAQQEIISLKEEEKVIEKELDGLIAAGFGEGGKKEKKTAAIIEIRSGVGGEEAALWARNLFEMYSSFAKLQGWKQEVLDTSDTDLGGIKEVIFELKSGQGNSCFNVFDKMKYEAGVHRVQRIPETEKSGRVHTSTATVAVLLKPREINDLKISPNDLKIEFFNATGPGGQNVNKRKTAVRVIHLPSGMVITSRGERSQLQNKENAVSILAARLLEKEQIAKNEGVSSARKAQIGLAKRAEKIRTYNFPQSRVTDHRIKKSWKILDEILKGKLEPVIEELEKNYANPVGIPTTAGGNAPAKRRKPPNGFGRSTLKTPTMDSYGAKENLPTGQGMIEGLILAFGILFIFAFALPFLFSKSGSRGQILPKGPAPLCNKIIVLPALTGKAPFKATFVGTARQTKYPILGFQWDFEGDGSWDTQISSQPQEHVFQSPGEYNLKMQILDEKQNSRICQKLIEVTR